MATRWYNIKGKIKWAKVYEPDEPSFGDKRWKIQFYPFDEKEWEKFDESGMQMEKKTDQDGEKYVVLRRTCKKLFPKDDEATFFNPPEITGAVNVSYVNAATGDKVRSFKKSEGIKIQVIGDQVELGNDTVGYVNIAVYDGGKGKGHRFESINVLDLVEFKRDPDFHNKKEEEAKADKQEKAKALKTDMNDELPF